MRIISLVLVTVGGLALGWEVCAAATGATGLVPPVVSGIVLVFGLLVLAATNRGDEDRV